MNKKVIFIALSIVLLITVVLLVMLFSKPQTNIKDVNISIGDSQIFSKEEINNAINVVLENFNFPATLNDIWYDEERSLSATKWYVDNYNYSTDEIIVLYSNFTTYSNTDIGLFMSGSLNPNSKYKDYGWILVHNNDNIWQLEGYGAVY